MLLVSQLLFQYFALLQLTCATRALVTRSHPKRPVFRGLLAGIRERANMKDLKGTRSVRRPLYYTEGIVLTLTRLLHTTCSRRRTRSPRVRTMLQILPAKVGQADFA